MSAHNIVYLDYNATTPVDKRVLDAMLPYFCEKFGNAASRNHEYGHEAAAAVEHAREQVASLIGADAKDVVFTSGATESDNIAIKGVAEMYADKGRHLVTARAEHKAVLDSCAHLEQLGWDITYLKGDEYGRVSPQEVADAIRDDTVLVSIMAANNEVGTINPVAEIGGVCRERGVFFHSDATQAVGKAPLDVEAMSIDLASLSAHKFYGPKGVGALYARRRRPRVRLRCQMDGGGHERGLRSGTLNVPGIVGMGAAAEIAGAERAADVERTTKLRDRLEQSIRAELDQVKLNGHPSERLCNTLNLSFAFVEGESMMMKMKDVAVSSASACTSATLEPSHVLKAMDVPEELAHNSIRFSLGRFTTEQDVDHAARRVVAAVKELRELSPLYDMAKSGIDLGRVQWQGH
jgi:cysteine desulfurase